MDKEFNIWEGVYKNFNELPKYGDGFESTTWIERSIDKIKKTLKLAQEEKSITEDAIFNGSPLYSIASVLYYEKKHLKILDFGGGMGNSFVPLCTVLSNPNNLKYTVVEGTENCISAEEIFKNDDRISFLNHLPNDDNFDIIHISSSLQYIENWNELLTLLCKYKSKYFIFTDLPAGDIIESYVSLQNYYESKIPHWFFKLEDIIKEMNFHNYQLIYKSNFQANILGEFYNYPQDNFQKEYQIGYSKCLVFKG